MKSEGLRVAELKQVVFPDLLDPVDDLPPATIITRIRSLKGKWMVQGTSHDNGDIAFISVNGQHAKIVSAHAGVVDWQITLDPPADGVLHAQATDKAGNVEKRGQKVVKK